MKLGIIEISVFLCGAIVMILEITASRIFAPFLGTSIYVWTGLIGIILGSLSLGYFIGGKLSDSNNASLSKLAGFVFLGGLMIAITAFIQRYFLAIMALLPFDTRLVVIISAVVLLAPASILLGMVSPYANRLRIKTLESSGETIGNLSAISTIGSIFGTFISGFVLLNTFGSSNILWGLSLVMILLAAGIRGAKPNAKYVIVFGLILLASFLSKTLNLNKNLVLEKDTAYAHVMVYDINKTRTLQINKERHSAINLNSDDLVFPYTKAYLLAPMLKRNPKNTLMLGGGAYTFPRYFLEKFPQASIDVVEIDPDLQAIATNFFGFSQNKRMKIYHQDGRVFLNKNTTKYDIIFGDAFASWYSLPYQLTTKEAIKATKNSLTTDGVFMVNTISALSGKGSKFLHAEYATIANDFPFVYVFPVTGRENLVTPQNIMIVASKIDLGLKGKVVVVENLKLKESSDLVSKNDTLILTDDYAPVENMILELM